MKVTFILLSTATSFFLSAVNAFDAKKIKAQLMKGQIIPDAFDEFEPTADMKITYGENILVENGDSLQPEITLTAPRISFSPKSDTEYTLAMINLDSNTPQVIHWMTTNINGKELESGNQLATYQGPTPPIGSGDHRVVYALFEQETKNTVVSPLSDRAFFNIKKFAADNKLKLVNAAYIYIHPQENVDQFHQAVKQEGFLDNLFDNIGDLIDDLGNIVGINIGNNDKNDDYNDGGIHIGVDLNDGVHIGVSRDHDGKISSVIRPSGKVSSGVQPSNINSVGRSSKGPSPPPHQTRILSGHNIRSSFSNNDAADALFTPAPN